MAISCVNNKICRLNFNDLCFCIFFSMKKIVVSVFLPFLPEEMEETPEEILISTFFRIFRKKQISSGRKPTLDPMKKNQQNNRRTEYVRRLQIRSFIADIRVCAYVRRVRVVRR